MPGKHGETDCFGRPALLIIVLLVSGFLLSGCVGFEYSSTSPGASGVVVDSQTRSRLSGAEVVVASDSASKTVSEVLKSARKPVVVTGEDGAFYIEAKWGYVPIPIFGCRFPPHGTLVVKREGYEPAAIVISLVGEMEVMLSPVGTKAGGSTSNLITAAREFFHGQFPSKFICWSVLAEDGGDWCVVGIAYDALRIGRTYQFLRVSTQDLSVTQMSTDYWPPGWGPHR